jgi:hypothetical protein
LESWTLILYFACGVGCGGPASVTLPLVYATQQQCTEAGSAWLSPNANRMHTVASFACNDVTRPKVFYRFRPEHYQE